MDSRRHGIRRVVTRVIGFLLLGAAINIAVAWATMSRAQCGDFNADANVQRVDSSGCVILSCASIGWERVWVWRWGLSEFRSDVLALMPSWSSIEEDSVELRQGEITGEYRMEIASGWPLLSLSCRFRSVKYDDVLVVSGIPTSFRPWYSGYNWHPFTLPTIPIWPGFAINTVFYAAVCWLLFAAPFAVRRRLRLRRRQCANCAYPVGTSDLCTECGKPVKP